MSLSRLVGSKKFVIETSRCRQRLRLRWINELDGGYGDVGRYANPGCDPCAMRPRIVGGAGTGACLGAGFAIGNAAGAMTNAMNQSRTDAGGGAAAQNYLSKVRWAI